jgi:hypothetical protein
MACRPVGSPRGVGVLRLDWVGAGEVGKGGWDRG